MTELTTDKKQILSKLYNLRGEDSVITTKIQAEIENINKEKKEKEQLQIEQTETKTRITTELETFTEQASNFLECFKNFDNASFSALDAIDVHIEFGTTLNKVKENMPVYQENLKKEIADATNQIEEQQQAIASLNNDLDNQATKLNKALEARQKLNNLLDDIIVNKNDSYNRSYVKKTLEEMNAFDEEEISNLEFLILFPERGLNEYNENYDKEEQHEEFSLTDETNENIVEEDIIDNNTDADDTEEKIVEQDIIAPEETITPVIEENNDEDEMNLISSDETDEKEDDKEEEEIKDIDNKESMIEFLSSINVDTTKFSDDAKELIEKSSKEILARNNEILRSIGAESVIFNIENGYMYLTDEELSQKINLIRTKNISDYTIAKEIENGNFQISYKDLEKTINALKDNNVEITEENISLLKSNIAKYYENISVLNRCNIELDEKEKRNFKELLQTTDYLEADTEILKDYQIKIVRKNGKYALETFWQKPSILLKSIDALIEADLEKILETNPEVLGKNIDIILEIVKYCRENNIPLIEEETNSFYKYVYDYEEFKSIFTDANISIKKNKVNECLKDINNKFIENLEQNFNITTPSIDEELLNTLPITNVNSNTYEIEDIKISKNKLARNLLSLKDNITEENKVESILIAMLFNSNENIDKVKKVIEKYLPNRI